MEQSIDPTAPPHTISVVIPVFGGRTSLPILMGELEALTQPIVTTRGTSFRVADVILVNDCGLDGSEDAIRELANRYQWV